MVTPFGSNNELWSSDDDCSNPQCFEPFQLVFARKHNHQLWPAAILGDAGYIQGFRVYFFRSKDMMDIPRKNILMYFENMLERQVSFRRYGSFKKGILKGIEVTKSTILPMFSIEARKAVLYEVPFFDVFLNKKQADEVLCLECMSKNSFIS